MHDPIHILAGARFRIRDCWPYGLRYLTMHLTPWAGGARRMRCGVIDSSTPVAIWRDREGRYRWHGRLSAGHATEERRFAPSLDVHPSEPYASEMEARGAADGAMLAWFAARIEDRSVVYPLPEVAAVEAQTLMFARRA